MAVANSLAGVKIGGARQVECTINGLGERAGNCSLEEIVMAVKTRKDYFGLDIGIDTRHIVAASRMVSQTTGFVVQPNKAVVGANAFAHASGIHQEDVGWTTNKIVLGKLSGRNAFKQRLQDLGVQLESESEINAAFARFKELADRKSEIFDEDILALVSQEAVTEEGDQYSFVSLSQHSETGERPEATIVIQDKGKEVRSTSDGNGPVDASLKAIENHVKSGAEQVVDSVNAISGSTESQGEVTVRLQNSGRVVNGVGSDPDIVVASAKAYLAALNKLHSKADRVAAQG
jgi:2-isopropylmalate synthase